MGPDPSGTGTKLARIKPCVYTGPGGSGTDRNFYLEPIGPIMKAIPYGTVLFQFQTGPVQTEWDLYHSGSDPKRILRYPIPCKRSLN